MRDTACLAPFILQNIYIDSITFTYSFLHPLPLMMCEKNKKIDQEDCDPKEREQKRVVRFWSTKLFTSPIWLTTGTLTDEYIYIQ
jgi:hypothetical protein